MRLGSGIRTLGCPNGSLVRGASVMIWLWTLLSTVSAFSSSTRMFGSRCRRTTYGLTATNANANANSARATFDEFRAKGRNGDGNGGLTLDELDDALRALDMDATPEEQRALFAFLDRNGDGSVDFEEFEEWYTSSVESAQETSDTFRQMLLSRRTVNEFSFDKTSPVSDDVLYRAIECAIAAPNRSGSEPWRFIQIGPQTVETLQRLNEQVAPQQAAQQQQQQQQDQPYVTWTDIPGWCVVTSRKSPNGDLEEEMRDFRSTACAMQNFMLSMWSEGVGSKWTEGPTQKTQAFADIVGIDTTVERVVGILWYGFVAGGLSAVDPKQERKKDVHDVLSVLP